MNRNSIGLLAVGLVMLLALPVLAQEVGNGASENQGLPYTYLDFYYSGNSNSGSITINNGSGGPIGVYYDPTNGPLVKEVRNPPRTLTITETINIAQTPNWTDWHEEMIGGGAGGWEWTDNPVPANKYADPYIVFGGAGAGQSDLLGSYNNSPPPTVDFYFTQQEVPGTVLNITKTLYWSDPMSDPPTTVNIQEWPTTPEPGALFLLLVAGLSGVAYRYWRMK